MRSWKRFSLVSLVGVLFFVLLLKQTPSFASTNYMAPVLAHLNTLLTSAVHSVELIGHIGGDNWGRRGFVQGNYAYIGEGYGITILDISTPNSPTVIGRSSLLSKMVKDIFVSENIAFVLTTDGIMHLLDVSNRASPREVGSYTNGLSGVDVNTRGNKIFARGDIAYISRPDGLHLVDISDPTNPVDISVYSLGRCPFDLFIDNNIAYLALGYDGLQLIDISNPAYPTLISTYYEPLNGDGVFDVYVSNDVILMAGIEVIRLLDVSNPANPSQISVYDAPGIDFNIFVDNNIAYVTTSGHGLRLVDIHDPVNPTEVGVLPVKDYIHYYILNIYVKNGIAYLVESLGGLRLIDVSNPILPTEVGAYEPPVSVNNVLVNNDIAYIIDRSPGTEWNYKEFHLINVSDPANPISISRHKVSGLEIVDIDIKDNIA